MLFLALVSAPIAAHAFELFGITFFGSEEDDEPPSPFAVEYEVEFEVVGDDDDLAERLQAASNLYTGREEPAPSPASLLARARGDYGRILAALYTQARYGGSIVITIAGRAPEEIAPDEDLADPVPVRVMVDPGPVFAFRSVAIENRPPPVPDDDDVPETPEELGLVPGGEARSGIVLASESSLIGTWRELGYPKAGIASRGVVADHPSDTIDVALVAAPGAAAVYGAPNVSGSEFMNPEFIVRQAGLEPGERFDPDDLEEANAQLRRLEVFQSTRIIEGDAVGPDGVLPLEIAVVERPRRVFGAGASYSTVDGASVEGYWQHRNLFGQAERLRVEGRVSGIGADGFNGVESFDYFAATTFVKPGVFTPYTDLTAQVSAKQEYLEAYEERSAAARIGLAHRFSDELNGSVAGNIERSRIVDPLGERDFLLASVPAELVFDNRDDPLDATSGVRARFTLEPFHEFEFQNSGAIARLDASTYFGFGENDRFVLAARAATGSIVGAPRDELPSNRLFFSGGGGSIRGYAYRNVGTRLESGEVVGGRSFVEGSLELRTKITENIGIVPFVDVGSVYESSIPDFSDDLRIGAGLGLRYNTGLGPLRLDVAVPLDAEEGDPSFAVYIGIGQAF